MDLEPAISILKQNMNSLAHLGISNPQEYIAQLIELDKIKPEDHRQAAQIAVNMSNSFITIAVTSAGIFVTYVGAYEQIPIFTQRFLLIGVVFLCFLISIWCGAYAVAGVWQRGEGRKETKKNENWSTEPMRTFLGVQPIIGLAALLLFAVLVATRNKTRGLEVCLPEGTHFTTLEGAKIVGEWRSMAIEDPKAQLVWHLPDTTKGLPDSIEIEAK